MNLQENINRIKEVMGLINEEGRQTTNVKPGVEELFDFKPEFANLVYGTLGFDLYNVTPGQKQQALQVYSQYLDTIFPDSKVKDIVYHGTNATFDKFDLKYVGKNTGNRYKSIFFTPNVNLSLEYGKNKIAALVNIKGEESIKKIRNAILKKSKLAKEHKEEFEKLSLDEIEEFLQSENNDTNKRLEDFLKETGVSGRQHFENKVVEVFDTEQIHILGSKQDIEGFENFINN
jgi:hypothetical protein